MKALLGFIVKIVRWTIGIILSLASLGGFAEGEVIAAFIVLIIGLLLIPPISALVFSRRKSQKSSRTQLVYDLPKPLINRNKRVREPGYKPAKTPLLTLKTSAIKDESIIDVTGQTFPVTLGTSVNKKWSAPAKEESMRVPYWRHQYVYSYSEINGATLEQARFYKHFKDSFLKGNYLDLEGNTNYAFILLFDLLNNDYETHKDLARLEKELEALGTHYPKTRSYATSFLKQKMVAAGEVLEVQRLQERQHIDTYQSGYDFDVWRLGTKYKEELNLQSDEVDLLNKLWYPNNNFCNIEFCCVQVIKLFLATIQELSDNCVKEDTSLQKELEAVADVVARKYYKYRKNSSNYRYSLESTTNDLYNLIFKHCENAVREHYEHKRKLTTDTAYTYLPEVAREFEGRIISRLNVLLPNLISKVDAPDYTTELELNAQNTSRWKTRLEKIASTYENDPHEFVKQVKQLGEFNSKNPALENIYFEASKLIAKVNQQAALTLYIYYVYFDLQSVTFNNKQLTKTIKKSLFKSEEQLMDFERIVSDLIKDRDLDKALQAIVKFESPKRKRIQLDKLAIKEVQLQHSGTVELLNEYLQDEEEDDNDSPPVEDLDNQQEGEVSFERLMTQAEPKDDFFIDGLQLSDVQKGLLRLFSNSSFTVSQQEVEDYLRTHGLLKNQVVDNINEQCYDLLDDVLIEEEEEYYTICENYFQQLIRNDK